MNTKAQQTIQIATAQAKLAAQKDFAVTARGESPTLPPRTFSRRDITGTATFRREYWVEIHRLIAAS